jgi:site-specific recombinase XerC
MKHVIDNRTLYLTAKQCAIRYNISLCQFQTLTARGDIINDLPDFEQHLNSKPATSRHIFETILKIKKISLACGFVKMTDLNADTLLRWLQKQTDIGMGARTRNSYREPMNIFCNWAISKGILHDNPFKQVPQLRENLDVLENVFDGIGKFPDYLKNEKDD